MMIQLLYLHSLHSLRKTFGNRDLVYYFVGLLLVLMVFTKSLYPYVLKHPQWFLFFSLQILQIHFIRKDQGLLKLAGTFGKGFRFLEYSFYSLPLLILYALTAHWVLFGILLLLVFLITLIPQQKSFIGFAPFLIFVPSWKTQFRKYRLWIILGVMLYLCFKGYEVGNIGLLYLALLLGGITVLSILFYKEQKSFVGWSAFKGEAFLLEVMKINLLNSTIFFGPLILLVMCFDVRQLWVFIPLFFVFMVAVLIKYAYYENSFQQGVIFVLFLIFLPYAIPLLVVPYFYRKSVQTLQQLQSSDVTPQN